MAFADLLRTEPSLLGLAVIGAGEHPGPLLGFGPLLEDSEPGMRNGVAVQV
jgi:hypothetical protein